MNYIVKQIVWINKGYCLASEGGYYEIEPLREGFGLWYNAKFVNLFDTEDEAKAAAYEHWTKIVSEYMKYIENDNVQN
jgi:hypothetical protein